MSAYTLFPINISDKSHIFQRIVCVRPARPAGIRIGAQKIGSKYVVHCYGHGGSGWTLAPGTTQQAVADFEKRINSDWAQLKGKDITIIGAGIIGYFSAYYLTKLKEKHPDIIGKIAIVADKLHDLASDHAGGLFEPVLIGHSGTNDQLINSYKFYQNVGLGRNPDFKTVDAELMPSISYKNASSTRQLIDLGLIPPTIKTQIIIGQKTHDIALDQLFFMNVADMRRALARFAKNNGITVQANIMVKQFSDIKDDIIFNCTGLGAGALSKDDNVTPYTGHLLTFQNQSRALLDIDNCLFIDPAQKVALGKAANTAIDALNGNISVFNPIAQKTLQSLKMILKQLEKNSPEDDPDWENVKRLRIFSQHSDRLDFIYRLSQLLLGARKKQVSDIYQSVFSAYHYSINTNLKRYMFGLVGQYKDPNTGKDYHGDAYAFPLLFGDLIRDPSGSYRYAKAALGAHTPVYVAGGTYIEGMNLPKSENDKQFQRIVERLVELGFER